MKKWIRWQGLLIFSALVLIFSLLWLLLADRLVENAIETAGTAALGAKVELDGADLSLFPAGLTLSGLTAANPDAPMRNAVQADRIRLAIETGPLFARKIVIQQMAVEALRFDTPREESGAIAKGPEGKMQEEELAGTRKPALPSFALPDVASVMQKEELLAVREAQALKEEIERAKETTEKRLEALPGKEALEDYRTRIEKLKRSRSGLAGIIGGAEEASRLQKEIRQDLAALKEAQEAVKGTLADLTGRVASVSQAPLKDFRRIRDKYALSPGGLANMTGLILGPEYAGWVEKGVTWYLRLLPMLERQGEKVGNSVATRPLRGDGIDIRFRETNPLPDFLIRKASVSLLLPAGEMAGSLTDVTTDQAMLGRPMTFRFAGEAMEKMAAATIEGAFDHVNPDRAKDTLKARIIGGRLTDFSLSDNPGLPLFIEEALVDLTLDGAIGGETVALTLASSVESARFRAQKASDNPVSEAARTALAGVRAFTLKASAEGTLQQQAVSVTSDLDRVLSGAVTRIIKQQTAGFEKKLKQAVLKQTDGPISELQQSSGGLALLGKNLDNRLGDFKELTGFL